MIFVRSVLLDSLELLSVSKLTYVFLESIDFDSVVCFGIKVELAGEFVELFIDK